MRSPAYFIARWLLGGTPGTLFYLDANAEEVALPRPADYADVQYVLVVDKVTGFPRWGILDGGAILAGFGTGFGTSFGAD